MKTARGILIASILLFAASNLLASGIVGIYCIVEKVAFEPNDRAPERMKVWGVFAFANPDSGRPPERLIDELNKPERGYLYFKLPSKTTQPAAEWAPTLKEWSDLKAVAGTGQAIAFGKWDVYYVGLMEGQPQVNMHVVRAVDPKHPEGLRVFKVSETRVEPVTYSTNAGIVKLGTNYSTVISKLQGLLKP